LNWNPEFKLLLLLSIWFKEFIGKLTVLFPELFPIFSPLLLWEFNEIFLFKLLFWEFKGILLFILLLEIIHCE
jgi:hypothetical protein